MSFVYIEIVSGLDKGKFYPLADGANSLGRNKNNTIVLNSQEKSVSNHHAIIYKSPGRVYFQDLKSTNGSYINEIRLDDGILVNNDSIRFGKTGTQLRIIISETELTAPIQNPDFPGFAITNFTTAEKENQLRTTGPIDRNEKELLSSPEEINENLKIPNQYIKHLYEPGSVRKNRLKFFFSDLLNSSKWQFTIVFLILVSLLPIAFFIPRNNLSLLDHKKPETDKHIRNQDEAELHTDEPEYPDSDSSSATSLTLQNEITKILSKFGEIDYSIPDDMFERVQYYLDLFSGKMKPIITIHIKRKQKHFPLIQRILKEKNLPVELAYIAMLESGLNPFAKSNAGAYGIWQFMPATARRFGLIVNEDTDERTDTEKSTYAAAAYFNELIALYGGDKSIMLAMAAYNAGEGKINKALKKIENPLKNRDFWYLYRKGYLAEETNEYIPKIVALIIICKNRKTFGFYDDEDLNYSKDFHFDFESDYSDIIFTDE